MRNKAAQLLLSAVFLLLAFTASARLTPTLQPLLPHRRDQGRSGPRSALPHPAPASRLLPHRFCGIRSSRPGHRLGRTGGRKRRPGRVPGPAGLSPRARISRSSPATLKPLLLAKKVSSYLDEQLLFEFDPYPVWAQSLPPCGWATLRASRVGSAWLSWTCPQVIPCCRVSLGRTFGKEPTRAARAGSPGPGEPSGGYPGACASPEREGALSPVAPT